MSEHAEPLQATPAPAPEPGPAPLWDVKACARYLRRSPRWVWNALTRGPEGPGSIPHIRLPGNAPRFVPEDVAGWVRAGCPPAATFKAWSDSASRKKRAG